MKIAVIGTINRDTIYPYKGPKIESYGGILYNLIALASLMPKKVTLFPVCNLGEDVRGPVFQKIDRFGNIDRRGIRIVGQKNNHAILRYTSPGDRKEFLENRVPALTFNQVEMFLDSDLILINFISGFDLSLETLRRVKDKSEGMIFLDVHSLTLGLAEDGCRFPKGLDNWREWAEQTNIIQLNGDEAQTLAGRRLGSYQDFVDFGREVFEAGPNVVLITLAAEGSIVVHGKGCQVEVARCPGFRTHLTDPTGCGDVFSAGFVAEYVRSADPVAANRFANRAASTNCTLNGLDELHKIGEIVQRSLATQIPRIASQRGRQRRRDL